MVTPSVLRASLSLFIDAGQSVIPLYGRNYHGCACYDRIKHKHYKAPRIHRWRETPPLSDELLNEWHTCVNPSGKKWIDLGLNYGWVIPQDVIVVDIEGRQIRDFASSGLIPDLSTCSYLVNTAGGGLHIAYRLPAGLQSRPVGHATVQEADSGYHFELRGYGNYVVVPPSDGHRRRWDWLNRPGVVQGRLELPAAPTFLRDLLKHPVSSGSSRGGSVRVSVSDFDIQECSEIPDGSQEDHLYRVACSLRARDADDDSALGILYGVVDAFVAYRPDDPWTHEHAEAKWSHVKDHYNAGPSEPVMVPMHGVGTGSTAVKAMRAVASVSPGEDGVIDNMSTSHVEAEFASLTQSIEDIVPTVLPSPSNPMGVARQLVEAFRVAQGLSVTWYQGDFYRWKGTHWEQWDNDEVKGWLYRATEHATYAARGKDGAVKQVPWDPTRPKIANLMSALAKGVLQRTDEPVDGQGTIAFTNTTLNLHNRELIPHTPEHFNMFSLPYAYDKNAKCPRWIKFLEETFGKDSEQIKLIAQMFGYILSGRTDKQVLFYILGEGGTGKGTIARVLRAMVGKRDSVSLEFDELTDRFGTESLINTSLAVVGEPDWSSRQINKVIDRVFSITGEDAPAARRKNLKAWKGELKTRFVFTGTQDISFGSATTAEGTRRLVLLTCKRKSLSRGERNTSLTAQLCGELPGILNWALTGLDDLDTAGDFLVPAETMGDIDDVKLNSNPVEIWADDQLAVDSESKIDFDEMFTAFSLWCIDHHVYQNPTHDLLWFRKRLTAMHRGDITSKPVRPPTVDGVRQKLVKCKFGLRLVT